MTRSMKRDDWTVGEHGIRPAGKPDECLYCNSKKGEQHDPSCVIRTRTVVVRMSLEYVVAVPEDWDAGSIEFHRNDSSWCSNNAQEEVELLFKHVLDREECLCNRMTFGYVREATEEDEDACGVRVADEPG